MTNRSTADYHQKYRCPSLAVRVMRKYLGSIARFIQKGYPLSAESEDLSCQPVFIISSGRSGTTLMRSMLVAGGQVAIPAETQMIHTLPVKFLAYRGLSWEDVSRLMIAEFESNANFALWETNMALAYQKILNLPEEQRSLAKLIDEVYLTYAAQKVPNAKIWGDQSPIHTFFLPYILKVFPRGKFMHLLRDGRDVISSMVERHGGDYIHEAVYRWKTSIQRTNEIQKRLPRDQYLEVRYERLVTDSENTLKEICVFLDIEYLPAMLDYWKLPSTIEHKFKSFHKNLEKPVFSSSIGKWRERLHPAQQEFVLSQISGELRELGYLS